MAKIKNIKYRKQHPSGRKPRPGDDDPYVEVKGAIPRSLYKHLELMAKEYGCPAMRLVNMCIDVTLGLGEGVDLYTYKPKDDLMISDRIAAEKLFRFLVKIPQGCGFDSLILARREMGLSIREISTAYHQLKREGLIEEYFPKQSYFKYPPEYRYIRAVGVNHKTMVGNRFKKFEGTLTPLTRATDERRDAVSDEVKARAADYLTSENKLSELLKRK